MKFFTPELYVRFNSPDDDEADRADSEWEDAIRRYEADLESFRDQMPPRVRELADNLCLHDMQIMVVQHEPSMGIVSVKQKEKLVVLFYILWGHMRKLSAPEDWPFSKAHVHWMYDEVDLDRQSPKHFWHRILLSDGSEVDVPFVDVAIHQVSLLSAEAEIVKEPA